MEISSRTADETRSAVYEQDFRLLSKGLRSIRISSTELPHDYPKIVTPLRFGWSCATFIFRCCTIRIWQTLAKASFRRVVARRNLGLNQPSKQSGSGKDASVGVIALMFVARCRRAGRSGGCAMLTGTRTAMVAGRGR